MVDISFYIDTNNINKLTNISTNELTKLQCIIKNDNENTIELYSNINYTFSFKANSTQNINGVEYGKYYFTIFENHIYNLDTTTKTGITYPYGLNKITIQTDNILKTTQKFKLKIKQKIYLVNI